MGLLKEERKRLRESDKCNTSTYRQHDSFLDNLLIEDNCLIFNVNFIF